MEQVLKQLLKNLYINQNFIWLVALYLGCYYAEKDHKFLYITTCILFVLVGISVISSLIAYSIEYYSKKIIKKRRNSLKLEFQTKVIEEYKSKTFFAGINNVENNETEACNTKACNAQANNIDAIIKVLTMD